MVLTIHQVFTTGQATLASELWVVLSGRFLQPWEAGVLVQPHLLQRDLNLSWGIERYIVCPLLILISWVFRRVVAEICIYNFYIPYNFLLAFNHLANNFLSQIPGSAYIF